MIGVMLKKELAPASANVNDVVKLNTDVVEVEAVAVVGY